MDCLAWILVTASISRHRLSRLSQWDPAFILAQPSYVVHLWDDITQLLIASPYARFNNTSSEIIMSQSYAPPSGPPPLPRRSSTDNLDIPDEAPPAYTPHAAQAGSTTVDAGPSRMDFSGPPPMPERLTNNITGVGMGYGPRIQGVSPQPTGSSGMASNNPFGDSHQPQLGRTDSSASFNAPSGPPPPRTNHSSQGSYGGNGGNGAGPSSGHADLSPTEVPTPGRPLLRNGQMLVYPKGHHCPKCGLTQNKVQRN